MAKMGRPTKTIDKAQFEKLCALQCTMIEVCDFFDVTEKTLEKWCKQTYGETFSKVFQKKRNLGKISLRRNQMKLSEKSATMAIFLGKNILGQKDSYSLEDDNAGTDNVLEVIFTDNSKKDGDGDK